jgi:uncharacterized membrane protein
MLEEIEKPTYGQRWADRIAKFGGSWAFIGIFMAIMLIWISVNLFESSKAFDPYPFILLNLVLSCLAALQAPIIMMSQNRQNEKDRAQAAFDYDINRKAETEIQALHEKAAIDHAINRKAEAEIQLLHQKINRLLDLHNLQCEDLEEMEAKIAELSQKN